MLKIILLFITTFILSGCSLNNNLTDNSNIINSISPTIYASPTTAPTPYPSIDPQSKIQAVVATTQGSFTIKLYADQTPNAVANFVSKANTDYYKNLTFHRVVPEFVAQGGDPLGTGTGGGEIKSELTTTPFKIGSVGLARTPVNRDISNDSQFFICLTTENCSSLTGDYVNFGEVVSGMEVVQKIKIGDKILNIKVN